MIAVIKRAAIALLLGTSLLGTLSRGQNLPITSIVEIKKLAETQLLSRPQVRVEGVITYYDPDAFLVFIQDNAAGIYIRTAKDDLGFSAGDLVRVEGLAAKGRLGNVIEEAVFKRLGRAPLPAPKIIQPDNINDLSTDCDLVQVKGVLRSISEDTGRLVYYVAIGRERIPVTIFTLGRGEGAGNLGRKVTITGVHAALFNERFEKYGMRLLCHSLRNIVFDESESTKKSNDLAVRSIKAAAQRTQGSLVRLQVIVDECKPGASLAGHDSTGSMLARITQHSVALPGTVVDIVGYVANAGGNVFLDDAYFQRIGFGNKRSFSPGESFPELSLIESVADIRRLAPEVAEQGHPVRLRGVITYYDPALATCFVQGATEGIYVHTHGQTLDIASGSLVTVSGYTAPGDFAPIVVRPKFDVQGKSPMPGPKAVAFSELLSGGEDSQWVQVECVVRSLKDTGSRYELEISPPGSIETVCNAFIPKTGDRSAPQDLIGSVVELQAVCATEFDSARRLKGIRFMCPGFNYVRVIESAESDPFALPLTAINSAFQFHPDAANNRRLHLLGVVTWTDHHGVFFIQDATGGLKVEAVGAQVELGQRLRVVGFRHVNEGTPHLAQCIVRDSGQAPLVMPAKVPATRAFADATVFEGRLLQTEGQLLEKHRTAEGLEMVLRDGDTVYSASILSPIPAVFAGLESAATVQLTGVATFSKDAAFQPRGFQLLLRSPQDVEILKAAPLWTARRMAKAVAILVAISLLAALWIAILRNRVARHKAMLEKNAERQRALEAQVLQAQKMESIGNLAGGVAHDFNNMLMVILGYADVLKGEKFSPDGMEALEEIAGAGKRAAELTRQLLVFSHKHMPQSAVLDLNEVVRGVTRMLGRLLGEDIILHFQPADLSLFVNADRGMIEQALMNLAVNSRDAMPRGGTLTIKTERRAITSSEAPQLPTAHDGEFVCLTVTDTGSGIAEEHLSKIFEPFFTTKEVGKGTGLGLSTVYGIVKRHGGWINVSSKLRLGTTFTIFLPEAAPAKPAARPAEPSEELTDSKATILLVEDEATVRRLALQTLRKAGYEIIEADCAPAALALIEDRPHIDLLITDVIMPGGMTGADLAHQIKAIYPQLPILLTSGYTEFRGRALEAPTDSLFLQKPYTPNVFLKTVREALAAKSELKSLAAVSL